MIITVCFSLAPRKKHKETVINPLLCIIHHRFFYLFIESIDLVKNFRFYKSTEFQKAIKEINKIDYYLAETWREIFKKKSCIFTCPG